MKLKRCIHADAGQGLVEYCFIAAMISILIFGVMALLGPSILRMYQGVPDSDFQHDSEAALSFIAYGSMIHFTFRRPKRATLST